MTINIKNYTYRVTWSASHNQFVGSCVEFPNLNWFAGTPESASSGIRNLIAEVIKEMLRKNEKLPESSAVKHSSGQTLIGFECSVKN